MQQLANETETADCTIIIPVPLRPSSVTRAAHPSTTKLPDVGTTPRMTLRLHTECLSARSAFFRGLFSGISPPDLIQSLCASRLQPPSLPLRVPRLLPSPPSHPIVFLPVPDPSSIQPLFHWMYFGSTDHIQNALDQGDIHWEGIARNVEYLGLSTDIKVFLGRWYRHRFLPVHYPPDCATCTTDESDDSDLDSDCDYSDADEIKSDDERGRGRGRDVKPLIRLCRRLRLRTAD